MSFTIFLCILLSPHCHPLLSPLFVAFGQLETAPPKSSRMHLRMQFCLLTACISLQVCMYYEDLRQRSNMSESLIESLCQHYSSTLIEYLHAMVASLISPSWIPTFRGQKGDGANVPIRAKHRDTWRGLHRIVTCTRRDIFLGNPWSRGF